MGTLEYRACSYRKVQLASVAEVETAFPSAYTLRSLAFWTGGAIRPQSAFEILSSTLSIGIFLEELKGAHC